jgi:hypothetical protein
VWNGKAAYDKKMCAVFSTVCAFHLKTSKRKSMLLRLAYRYHRFLGIMFITIMMSGLIKIDFSKTRSIQSNSSNIQKIESDLSSVSSASVWINSGPEPKRKVASIESGEYTCVNGLRTLPDVRAWAKNYRGNGRVSEQRIHQLIR